MVRYWVVIANAGGSGTLHVVPDASHFDTAPFDTNGGQTLVTFTATLKNPIPDQNASVTVSANGVAITSQSAM
ncbi:MAG TPA: hypothetical protein VMI31_12060 [Fimbriimonadaceae bacterium]|nr:hypothetical protein [Fimbriimonadaceae bacterium]